MTRFRHPVNRELIDEAPVGARVADRVTGYLGSWAFIGLHADRLEQQILLLEKRILEGLDSVE